MSKADKQGKPQLVTPIYATPEDVRSHEAQRSAGNAALGAETFIRLRRHDYLRCSVEEVTMLAGKEISRRVLHAPDSPGVALGKAYEALERMVET